MMIKVQLVNMFLQSFAGLLDVEAQWLDLDPWHRISIK